MKKSYFLCLVLVLFCSSALAEQKDVDLTITDFISRGNNNLNSGKINNAVIDFKKAIELEPNNIVVLDGLGRTYLYLDMNKEAEKVFSKIITLDPNNVSAWVYLGKLYSWDNRYDKSIEAFNNAIRLDPKNIDAKLGLAEVYSWAGFHKSSVEQYENLLAEDPRNTKVYKGLAQVYLWDNRLNDAERIYRDAIELSPNDPVLHNGLGKIYYYMGDWVNAEKEYRKVLSIDDSDKEAILGLEEVKRELIPTNEFILGFIHEVDANNWRATRFTYGYKNSRPLNFGNSIYGAYYVNDLRETDKVEKVGNTFELGGLYNLNHWFSLRGSTNLNTYSHEPDFLAAGDIAGILKYMDKNTLVIKTTHELFDPLDNIRNTRYAVESNIYLGKYFLLNDNLAYNDYSDGNNSRDSYHILNWMPLKKNPDLTIGFGYRHRDFKTDFPEYYSPKDLDTYIYSLYSGRYIGKGYLYGLFKYMDNSDHNDNQYYLGGYDYAINKDTSVRGEVSYFKDETKYHSLTATMTVGIKF